LEIEKTRLGVEVRRAQNTYQSFSTPGRTLTANESEGQNAAALDLRRLYHAFADVLIELGTLYKKLSELP
jgi:hypothetical protein